MKSSVRIIWKYSVFFLVTGWLTQATAITIRDDVFIANGGSKADIKGTIARAMEPLRLNSYSSQYLSVVDLGGCTGTWLGDSTDNKSVFVLTARHCIGYLLGISPNRIYTVIDWNLRKIAEGKNLYYLPPGSQNNNYMRDDIAILKIPKIADILDHNGRRIEKPIIYDLSDK
ncbi:hypothetical protein [Labrys sp. 22185]|uniref:hypothetical protein n=1 Tax=Labrys sp. 22185 TaxID=3453888 RepID=UPI003F825667